MAENGHSQGFFRDHDLIILDEPTAAIDPYEETRIYNRFAEIARNKSAVIVTHRLWFREAGGPDSGHE